MVVQKVAFYSHSSRVPSRDEMMYKFIMVISIIAVMLKYSEITDAQTEIISPSYSLKTTNKISSTMLSVCKNIIRAATNNLFFFFFFPLPVN